MARAARFMADSGKGDPTHDQIGPPQCQQQRCGSPADHFQRQRALDAVARQHEPVVVGSFGIGDAEADEQPGLYAARHDDAGTRIEPLLQFVLDEGQRMVPLDGIEAGNVAVRVDAQAFAHRQFGQQFDPALRVCADQRSAREIDDADDDLCRLLRARHPFEPGIDAGPGKHRCREQGGEQQEGARQQRAGQERRRRSGVPSSPAGPAMQAAAPAGSLHHVRRAAVRVQPGRCALLRACSINHAAFRPARTRIRSPQTVCR
jgi:hypothetical protein